jgi:hypothetical protein
MTNMLHSYLIAVSVSALVAGLFKVFAIFLVRVFVFFLLSLKYVCSVLDTNSSLDI